MDTVARKPGATLVIEPFGGLAGDMFLAALLDLDQPAFRLGHLQELARGLVPEALELQSEECLRGALRGTCLHVRTPETEHPPHRHLSDLERLVAASALSAAGQARALCVLRRIAEAESRVHGIAIEQVHFHEVGAIDTLIDVCGVVDALERLGIGRILARPPYVGGGTVRCAHGTMPVPAPGTAELLVGMPHHRGPEGAGERLTPTGAALLAELVDEFLVSEDTQEPFETLATGYGAGTRDPTEGPPNLVRVSFGRVSGASARRRAWMFQCNLDDTTPEEVGFLLQELRSAGALEAWSSPVQMKKDRPGVVISALCRAGERATLEELAFRHSPTLGVRWMPVERSECAREQVEVTLELGDHRLAVRVKLRLRPGGEPTGPLDLSPEYDDLAAAARASGRPLRELEELARSLARAVLSGEG